MNYYINLLSINYYLNLLNSYIKLRTCCVLRHLKCTYVRGSLKFHLSVVTFFNNSCVVYLRAYPLYVTTWESYTAGHIFIYIRANKDKFRHSTKKKRQSLGKGGWYCRECKYAVAQQGIK